MMANYQAMLTELHGQNACLLLDAQHSAIDKIDCADIGSLIDGSTNAKDEAKEEDQNQIQKKINRKRLIHHKR